MKTRRFHSDGSLCRSEAEVCPAASAHRDCLQSALGALGEQKFDAHGPNDYSTMDALEMLRLGAHNREILRVIWNNEEPTDEERLELYNLLENRSQLLHVMSVAGSDSPPKSESGV